MKILRNDTDRDPGAFTPSGAVGLGTTIAAGDITGTHGVPIVSGVQGVGISGTPSAGYVLTATGATGAAWAAPATVSPLTTKGDVWGYSTLNARIPIGTDTFVLTADSTQALGLKWAASSGGGATGATGATGGTGATGATGGTGATGATGATGGGGGGGLAASYLGYNTAGGSTASWATAAGTAYVKKITTTGQSVLLSIGVYIAMQSLAGTQMSAAVWSDSSGPDKLLAVSQAPNLGSGGGFVGHNPAGSPIPGWIDFPIGTLLAASTSYWIGVDAFFQATSYKIYFDGSGSDGIITMTDTAYVEDGTYRGSFASGSNKYSIRALILS